MKESSVFWLSVLSTHVFGLIFIVFGLIFIVLSFGRTFEVNNVVLDVIFGIFGGFGCILGGMYISRLFFWLPNKEKNEKD